MPSTRIIAGQWARGHERELMEAVQAALLSAIKIPDWDRDSVVELYDPDRRIVPSGRSERFTRVEIELFSGRSIAAKRALYRAVVANLGKLGVPADEVKTILIEIPADNWGIRGGVPASDVDLGFKIDV